MKSGIRLFLGVLCLSLAFAAPRLRDGASAWKQIGPDGGYIMALARNPKTPGELYALASASPARVYRSVNGGSNWARTASLPSTAYDLVTDSVTPGVVYALHFYGIYKSTNRAAAFKDHRFPKGATGDSGSLAVNPVKAGVIHASGIWYDSKHGNYIAVYTSRDGGRTWTVSTLEGPVDWIRRIAIAVSPKAPNTLYAAAFYVSYGANLNINRVYKSINGGATWKRMGSLPLGDDGRVYSLAIDPSSDQRVFLATSEGVLYTTNGGASWKKPAFQTAAGVASIAVEASRPRTVYAQSDTYVDGAKFYRSLDGGVQWASAGTGVCGFGCGMLTGSGRLYLASCAGVFASRDGGLSFKPSQKGIRATNINAFATAPGAVDTIYAHARGYSYFTTENGGAAWKEGVAFPGSRVITEFAVSAADRNLAYILATSPDGTGESVINKTTDRAVTVTPLLRGMIFGLSLDPADAGRLYAAGWFKDVPATGPMYFGVWRTLNGGATWTRVKVLSNAGSRGTAVGIAPSDRNIVYAGGRTGSLPGEDIMCKSSDGGTTWSRLAGVFDCPPEFIGVDPVAPGIVYVGTTFSVYRSMNGGGSWTKLSGIHNPYAIAINKLNPAEVFVGTYDGIFYSRDKGTTWTDISAGLPAKWVGAVELDPAARKVYAGTIGAGVCCRGF
jgi:photosystem II stability/assembly factor-like uncharacterized protein